MRMTRIGNVTLVLAAAGLLASSVAAGEGCCSKKEATAASHASCGKEAGAGHAGCGASSTAPAPKFAARPGRELTKEIQPVFDRYIDVQTELASDSTMNLPKTAGAMADAMRMSGSGCLSGAAKLATAVGEAKDIKSARAEFSKLSDLLVDYVAIANVAGYHGFYCGMAKAGWLQKETAMKNPYMGKEMLECGKQVF